MFTLDAEFGCGKRNENTDMQNLKKKKNVNECTANAVKVI